MARREPARGDEGAPPARSMAGRVARATGRVLWGTVKLAGRVLWWTGKTGYRVGKRVARSRAPKPQKAQGERPPRG